MLLLCHIVKELNPNLEESELGSSGAPIQAHFVPVCCFSACGRIVEAKYLGQAGRFG